MCASKKCYCKIARLAVCCTAVSLGAMFGNPCAADVEGITNPYDTAGTARTETGTITGTAADVISVTGAGTLNVFGLTNTGYLGGWNVASGTTLASDNSGTDKETIDSAFGAGTITLNAATLKTCNNSDPATWLRRISNDIIISGNSFLTSTSATEMHLCGDISGSGNIRESVSYSLYLKGDNSAYTGNWELTSDWTWTANAASKTPKTTGSDYSFGSGTITVTGGGIASMDANGLILNDIVLNKGSFWYKNGSSLTFRGKITGNSDWTISAGSTPKTIIEGDGTGYTKNWIVDGTTANVTLASNNNVSVSTGIDPRFGSGTIYLKGGTATTAALLGTKHRTYIHNNIVNSGNTKFSADSNVELQISGNISGSGTITEEVGWSMLLTGNNSAYTGDWVFTGDYVGFSNDGTAQPEGSDLSFGSGTIYLNGGGLRTITADGTRGFINTNIVVSSGKNGSFRYGPFTLTGDVTVNGRMISDTANGDPIVTIGDTGLLQGNGSVHSRVIMADGSVLSGGTADAVGTLTFERTLELQSGATLQIDVAADGSFDKIVVNDMKAAKDIAVDILFDENFNPESGWTADILTVNGTGTFEEGFDWGKIIHVPSYFDILIGANGSVSLVGNANALPEPSACLMLLLGLGGMFVYAPKFRKKHQFSAD